MRKIKPFLPNYTRDFLMTKLRSLQLSASFDQKEFSVQLNCRNHLRIGRPSRPLLTLLAATIFYLLSAKSLYLLWFESLFSICILFILTLQEDKRLIRIAHAQISTTYETKEKKDEKIISFPANSLFFTVPFPVFLFFLTNYNISFCFSFTINRSQRHHLSENSDWQISPTPRVAIFNLHFTNSHVHQSWSTRWKRRKKCTRQNDIGASIQGPISTSHTWELKARSMKVPCGATFLLLLVPEFALRWGHCLRGVYGRKLDYGPVVWFSFYFNELTGLKGMSKVKGNAVG